MLDKTSFLKSKSSYNKRTPGQYQFNPTILVITETQKGMLLIKKGSTAQ
jgi:hypothetical protein